MSLPFIVPGLVLQRPTGGIQTLEIDTPLASAKIALQGAHVLHWQPAGCVEPVLWMSPQARFEPGRAIRGGIPVCWPWFGAYAGEGQQPAHGYARTADWALLAAVEDAAGNVHLTLALDNCADPALGFSRLSLQLDIVVGHSLQLTLSSRNAGTEAVKIGEALHTYFRISDIGQIAVTGLDGGTYWDTVGTLEQKVQQGVIRFAGETDRVYIDSPASTVIEDPGLGRRIRIDKQGSLSSVVWNPWTAKAARMGDLGQPDGWRGFVCVETANVWDNCVMLAPGAEHRMQVEYRVEAYAAT